MSDDITIKELKIHLDYTRDSQTKIDGKLDALHKRLDEHFKVTDESIRQAKERAEEAHVRIDKARVGVMGWAVGSGTVSGGGVFMLLKSLFN